MGNGAVLYGVEEVRLALAVCGNGDVIREVVLQGN